MKIDTGSRVILGAAIIGGPASLLARNVGPEPANFGLNPDSILTNPYLKFFSGDNKIAENDDWDLADASLFDAAGAFPFQPGSKDAALHVEASTGSHTDHATGIGTGGVALIELYELN